MDQHAPQDGQAAINGAHVLIVDDEKSICDILGQYLGKCGYSVHTATSGEEAIQLMNNTPVDLVLSDIKMPGMSGVEFLKWAKDSFHSVPVLLTTGFPTMDTAIEALKLGAFDYLTKPFHLEEIGEKVKRALISKQLEEENLLFSKLVSLHEVTKILASTREIGALQKRVLDFSIRIAKADGGALMFYANQEQLGVFGVSPPEFEKELQDNPFYAATARWAVEKGEPLVVVAESPDGVPDGVPPLPASLQSFIAFPLKTPKKMVGVINLIRRAGASPFTNLDLEIINVLASQASISLENARLYQNIRNNYLKTIRAFALAVEVKDRYTHGHSENVMRYTVVLARQLGMSEAEIENVKYAGLLHDIGKIGISEMILNKPGRLTDAEFREIKKHPELGAKIISDIPFFHSLVPLVLHHHEKYNGSGYPEGIAGDDIPLGARILSIADAYEAMTSDRPYRKALSQEVALDILRKERGNQFDAQIAEVFIDIVQKNLIQK